MFETFSTALEIEQNLGSVLKEAKCDFTPVLGCLCVYDKKVSTVILPNSDKMLDGFISDSLFVVG